MFRHYFLSSSALVFVSKENSQRAKTMWWITECIKGFASVYEFIVVHWNSKPRLIGKSNKNSLTSARRQKQQRNKNKGEYFKRKFFIALRFLLHCCKCIMLNCCYIQIYLIDKYEVWERIKIFGSVWLRQTASFCYLFNQPKLLY